MATPITKITATAAKIVQAWRIASIALPNMKIDANGISSSKNSSKYPVKLVGLSNGAAELALKKPPPLVPSCLIAICEATGPRAMSWVAPWTVCATAWPEKVSRHALGDQHDRADDRQRQQDVTPATGRGRPRSSPACAGLRCEKPRMTAASTAMPTAAETKFCTARPAIWVR